MKKMTLLLLSTLFLAILILNCNNKDDTTAEDSYDVNLYGIPEFVVVDYIELDKISRISRFRSAAGHDYWDNFESCRSMKHYFEPKAEVDWSAIKIFSPVDGKISKVYSEWAGKQLHIKSDKNPAFYFIIFHVQVLGSLEVGDKVTAGQQLGTHIGDQTMSDIAVGVQTPNGWKLVSWFETLADSIFEHYQDRGVGSRDDLIITKQDRDNDPLVCEGKEFISQGNLENWAILN
ncbi:MAG: hypothetical protein ACOYVF_00785 [Candidatus Zixiibacteriota bacterium]